MKGFFKIVLGTITGFILFILIGFLIVAIATGSDSKEVELKDNSIVTINLSGNLQEDTDNFLDQIFNQGQKPVTLEGIRAFVNEYKTNDKVKGLFLNFKGLSASLADAGELRTILADFQRAGKTIYTFSEYYSQSAYYVASVADSVFVSPGGAMDWKGLSAQIMFYKEALDKLGVEMQIIRHGKFKSAVEPFMLNEMSEANRKQTQQLVDDLWKEMLNKVSESRNISIDQLNQLADDLTIYSRETAVAAGMVDKGIYYQELVDQLKEEHEWIAMNDLSIKNSSSHKKGVIAVLRASGEIVDGSGETDQIGGDRFVTEINKLKENDKVDAVILEINSPGGSALASDNIWKALVNLKKEKPVIAYMTNYAASGGYYIAAPADSIIAHPGTITGSIGVFGMIPNADELLREKIGVNVNVVNTNEHSHIGTIFHPLSDFEKNRIQMHVEEIYDRFISIVADGRGMTKEQVDSIGQGRVWSGTSALEIGLVDKLGGLQDALDMAQSLANVDEYVVRRFPEKEEWQRQVEALFTMKATDLFFDDQTVELIDDIQSIKNHSGILARPEYFIDIR